MGDACAAYRAELRAFLEERMRGNEHLRWSATWSTREEGEEYEFRLETARQLGNRGWLFPSYPAEYGGSGLPSESEIIRDEEFDRAGLPRRLYYTLSDIVAPTILIHGTPEQRELFLPGMLKGIVSVWQVLTEPQGGSDVANCLTTAVRDGTDYIINGQKVMVGSKHDPHWLWTLVNTDPGGERHKNLGWVMIPADLPGISYQPMHMMMGLKNTIYFDNVKVPLNHLVGGENNGWKVSRTHMELEHGGGGSIRTDSALAHLLELAGQPSPNGRALLEDGEARDILAEAIIDSEVTRLMAARNMERRQIGEPHPYGGSQLRYFQRMAGLRHAERLQKLFGFGALAEDTGVDEEDDFEHLVREGPGHLHGGGTLDTDRLIVARRMGLGRRTPEAAARTTAGAEGQRPKGTS